MCIRDRSGEEHINIKSCEERGIKCKFLPEPNSESAAEHTLMLMLNLLRNFSNSQTAIQSNKWKISYERGRDISETVFGIIGYGRVGRRVSGALKSLGAEVITFDPYVKDAGSDLDAVLANSDLISLHVPSTEETAKLVDKNFISKMKAGTFIVNTSRGSVLCEEALLSALKNNKIAGAALDVFEKEPLTKDSQLRAEDLNIILTPHAGSWTETAFIKASQRARAEIVSFFESD